MYKMFAERKKIFASWVHGCKSVYGFECACPRCSLLRAQPQLAAMDSEVHQGYSEAARLVTFGSLPMAAAGEVALPIARRKKIIASHDELSLTLQHAPIRLLKIMEGASLAAKGQARAALEAYELAAAIGYEVRGGGPQLERLTDLCRVAGAAFALANEERAMAALCEAWKCCKAAQSVSSAAFIALAEKYTLPWWIDSNDGATERAIVVALMAKRAIKSEKKKKRA